LISNPAARGATINKFDSATKFLQDKGFNVKLLLTEKGGDATHLAQEAVRENLTRSWQQGGDGQSMK
jgi:diacylglycerol kinase family enzyme